MNIKKFYEDTNSSYQGALSIMMNDFLIERMIKKFMESNSYQSIIEAYEANNIKEVFALSHSFKGVTGNLSLTNLFKLASELTEATRNKESADIKDLIEQLKAEYKVVVDAFNALNNWIQNFVVLKK